ncbi:MAG: hypothetical protein ACLS3M_08615 [Collinsella sp.]
MPELRPGQRVHGSPLSSQYYKSMMGKTIKSVTFYTLRAPTPLPRTSTSP